MPQNTLNGVAFRFKSFLLLMMPARDSTYSALLVWQVIVCQGNVEKEEMNRSCFFAMSWSLVMKSSMTSSIS
jgi:hypothetical protein